LSTTMVTAKVSQFMLPLRIAFDVPGLTPVYVPLIVPAASTVNAIVALTSILVPSEDL
jgi:hypothetical protein